MPGLIRGVARTAVVAGTATAVSNRVSRRQATRWAADAPPQQRGDPRRDDASPVGKAARLTAAARWPHARTRSRRRALADERAEQVEKFSLALLQAPHAPGKALVTAQKLIDNRCLRLVELAVDIGHQEFVAQLGHAARGPSICLGTAPVAKGTAGPRSSA